MANVVPFRGIVYDPKKVGDLSRVVAPPYDIIPKRQQDELYKNSPFNIVRLELGKIRPSDTKRDNRYVRAGRFFESWLRDGQMVRDEEESIYMYSQRYKESGRVIDRIGFIALMGLDEGKRKVLPHENTLLAPKMDRLELIRSVKANLSPIYILYEDPKHRILKILKKAAGSSKPFMSLKFEGIENRAWRLSDPKDVSAVVRIMKNSNTFIADGHHRFEVTRMYSKEAKRSSLPEEVKIASRFVMVYFVDAKEDMLTVLPAHRLPKDIGSLTKEDILARLGRFFIIEEAPGLSGMLSKMAGLRNRHIFGLYAGKKKFYTARLRAVSSVDKAVPDKPKDWRRLDVSILHKFIFQNVLNIRDDDDNIEFVKSPEETAELVDMKKFKVAFFLNPTKVAEIKRIARLGEKMPRKATYFFPKPISGVVINKLG